MKKPRIDRPVLVEGKYDKATLLSIFDATVLTTGGFSLFRKKETQALFRKLAAARGILVLTDPDGAGRVIRGFLSGILPKDKVTHLYVPAIEGKEKRKDKRSAAGLLGVEGVPKETLLSLFAPYIESIASEKAAEPKSESTESDEQNGDDLTRQNRKITKTDFYLWGLSGGENATRLRAKLAKALSLPTEMSANALLAALNLVSSREECEKLLPSLRK